MWILGKPDIKKLVEKRDIKELEKVLLKDKDPQRRQDAAIGLADIGDPRALSSLIVALKDNVPTVREAVVNALGKLPNEYSISPLFSMLDDSAPFVQEAAIIALGLVGSKMSFVVSTNMYLQLREYRSRIREQSSMWWKMGEALDRIRQDYQIIQIENGKETVREYCATESEAEAKVEKLKRTGYMIDSVLTYGGEHTQWSGVEFAVRNNPLSINDKLQIIEFIKEDKIPQAILLYRKLMNTDMATARAVIHLIEDEIKRTSS